MITYKKELLSDYYVTKVESLKNSVKSIANKIGHLKRKLKQKYIWESCRSRNQFKKALETHKSNNKQNKDKDNCWTWLYQSRESQQFQPAFCHCWTKNPRGTKFPTSWNKLWRKWTGIQFSTRKGRNNIKTNWPD